MNSKKKTENPNRDPLTCEPGSHPVGTGAGALAGGAPGAAVGAVGGPIGSAVGAAAGAVAGGLGGHAAAEKFNPTHSADLGRFIDYTVVDHAGNKVGTVDAVWEDGTGQPYYLAVRTGWLHLGKAHVVPAQNAEVNESSRKIRLPYDAELMKNAPAFDCAADMDEASHGRIRDYFGIKHGAKAEKREKRDLPVGKTTRDEAHMTLKAEEVKIGKREVEYGGLRLRKIVRTETVNQPVELRREEIVIERTPVQSGATCEKIDAKFDGEEIYIPLRREEAVVEKTVRNTEEVRVGKRTEIDRKEVSESFRREEVKIEKDVTPHEEPHHVQGGGPSCRT
jgi:uncharacterized protein (TIGR02271 family)